MVAGAQPADFTSEQASAAIVEAATARFTRTVKEPFLDKGMTVRSLRWALEQLPKQRGPIDPAMAKLLPGRFDEKAGASAKLQLDQGRVFYTASATARDDAAAVLNNEREELRLGYLVVAEVTSDGELRDPEVRRVEALRGVRGEASARASRK